MATKIITISREFGSGGRSIGREVAKRLGIPFYDKELVDQIALASGFSPDFVAEHGEHSPTRSRLAYAFSHQSVPGVMNGMSTADFLWSVQCNVIMQLADQGPCVIVGRNADYILKDRRNCLNVFIHADKEHRADRIVRLYGESEKSPEARLNEKDKRRAINYQHYTGQNWGQTQNYDLCLNSGKLGIDACVDLIVSLASKE
jgi:cytidylate kinase